MKYLSVCSGIEAASVAWHPLGWSPVAFSEIEAFPSAVLAHHYPSVPNWGDMTRYEEWPDADVDVLVGGTPCQSFSVAGLRKGLDDPRGNLMLTFGALARRYRPRWLVWENVPGVLSSNGGRDFGTFLGMLAELGYGFAYRVLDAQYVRTHSHARAVPQRRRRVFVVGCLGDWRRAAAVLFERESLSGHPAPRREAGKGVAGATQRGFGGGGENLARTVTTGEHTRQDWETCTMIAHALRAGGFDASEDGTGRGTPIVPVSFAHQQGGSADLHTGTQTPAVAFSSKDHGADAGEVSPTLCAMPHDGSHANGGGQVAVAFDAYNGTESPEAHTLRADTEMSGSAWGGVRTGMAVRRLTPRECERLQGFPDDYTDIPWRGKPNAPDGPRYKALGNSMAVNVMSWIGQRIQLVHEIQTEAADAA